MTSKAGNGLAFEVSLCSWSNDRGRLCNFCLAEDAGGGWQMLNEVLGRLFFLEFLLPSMLPSREPLTLVPCDSGSANMIEPVLFVGEGGPESWPITERVFRF